MRSASDIRAHLARHPFPDNPWVQVTDEGVLIRAGYNEAMQRMLRWVPGARWAADRRLWLVPLAGVELVRSVLPELSRLAEAMEEERRLERGASTPGRLMPDDDGQARQRFRASARLLFGSDWQRETARALGRDEAALACWLVGEGVAEAPPRQLLQEMLALMQHRAQDILDAAQHLEHELSGPSLSSSAG